MNRSLPLLLMLSLVALLAASAEAREKKPRAPKKPRHDALGAVVLNGEPTEVRWTDGDSFKVKTGPHQGKGTRLVGYNTLEAYGPVHSWGKWTAAELYEVASGSAAVAATQSWVCTTDGKEDGYHRLLVDCPELAVEMARSGYGMAYAVDGTKPSPRVLEAQREAQTAGRGMWEKGVVKGVVTSVHSLGEDGDETDTVVYNRVVDTRTGAALKRAHDKKYGSCEKVCETTEGDVSCLVYVPFKHRYRQQPDCLRIQAPAP
jgi:endonuclease YncB( thermonuclease family)